MANQDLPPILVAPLARRRSWVLKLLCMGALIVALHVPLFMTHGVLRERQRYQEQAIHEISSVWGREQSVTGPVLVVPYTYKGTTTRNKLVNGQSVQIEEPALLAGTAYFLPEELSVDGVADPEIRHRGIYDAVVFTTRMKVAGAFRSDFAGAGIEAERILWDKARVLFGVSDLHGVRSITPLRRGEPENVAPFETVDGGNALRLALGANVGSAAPIVGFDFSFDVVVQGSGTLTVAPVGKTTRVILRSPWRDPSFTGAWLPTARRVDANGFTAEWNVAHFSRGFPQAWTNRLSNVEEIGGKIQGAALGVRFARGIDGYSMVERAQKYGVLFFATVFAVFFLFEVTAELRIHPLQYAMVGAALCLFFLAFLALSEFWPVGVAYGVAAGACTLLVSVYAYTFLHSGRRTFVVLGGLASTYGCLFLVLQSQDYALIAGTTALFATLAAAMFFTRRIDWYALDSVGAGKTSASAR